MPSGRNVTSISTNRDKVSSTEVFSFLFFQWVLPIPVHNNLMSLPHSFLRDRSYIMLAKAQELAGMQVSAFFFLYLIVYIF